MQKKETKTNKNRRINPKKFVVFFGCVAVFVYFFCILMHQQACLKERGRIVKEYEEKISNAKLAQQQLKKELSKVKTNEYLEKMAREKLGLVKPNERVFVDVTKDK